LNNGIAGIFGSGGSMRLPGEARRFEHMQQWMDFVQRFNVMGEDLARVAVTVESIKRGLKDPNVIKQLDDELAEAVDLNNKMQLLLEAVARGEFANGKKLTPELGQIRNDALQKADDFLGGARGLTTRQRRITSVIPFWSWYKHIFKLYFYTLPVKYPGRSLALNAMARLGYEQSVQNGFYDSFYEDAIKIGEEARGPNVYSKALTTNIFPFTFGGVFEYEEGAPGVQFATGNIAPTLTVPARLVGIGIPGAPIIGSEGERLKEGDIFAPGYGEAAVSELERLIAPVGLAQRAVAPRTSLIFDAYRAATDQDIPSSQPQGQGEQYAVTPRGAEDLGLGTAAWEGLLRGFGLSINRIPVRGPVAERRLRDEEARLEEEARKRYRESLGLDY